MSDMAINVAGVFFLSPSALHPITLKSKRLVTFPALTTIYVNQFGKTSHTLMY